MLNICNNVIKMTRGDTGFFDIKTYTPDQKIYKMKANDKVIFYLMKDCGVCLEEDNYFSDNVILKKEFKNNYIVLQSGDTQFLKYGEYFWKCVLYCTSDGERIVNTVGAGKFYLTEI